MKSEITLYQGIFTNNDGSFGGATDLCRTYDDAYTYLPDGDGEGGGQVIEKVVFEVDCDQIAKEHDLEGWSNDEICEYFFENSLYKKDPVSCEVVFEEKILRKSEKIDKENEGTDALIVKVHNELSKRFDDNVGKYTTLYVDDDGFVTTNEEASVTKLIRIADHTHNDRRPVDLDVVISNVDATKMKFVESHRNVLRFNGTATVKEIVDEILNYKFRV